MLKVGVVPGVDAISFRFAGYRLNRCALDLYRTATWRADLQLLIQYDLIAREAVFRPELPWCQRFRRVPLDLELEHVSNAQPFHRHVLLMQVAVERRRA